MNDTITSVDGVLAGHWNDNFVSTGVTALLFPRGARFSTTILGGASCTRHVNSQNANLTNIAHGVCFAGGSAFGLSAADGIIKFLSSKGIGFDSGYGKVPIVPTAVIFDLASSKTAITMDAGYYAAESASNAPLSDGMVGVGAGATFGKWIGIRKRGGIASVSGDFGKWRIGVISVVNAVGLIRNPENGNWLFESWEKSLRPSITKGDWSTNTTLVAIVTDAPLDRYQLSLMGNMASAGISRTVYPAFTPFDGDVLFSLSTSLTGRLQIDEVAHLSSIAAELVEHSILKAVSAR